MVMVDEYQDINHIQERSAELLVQWPQSLLWWRYQAIYRFRPGRPVIFNEKFQRYAQTLKKASHSQGKFP